MNTVAWLFKYLNFHDSGEHDQFHLQDSSPFWHLKLEKHLVNWLSIQYGESLYALENV